MKQTWGGLFLLRRANAPRFEGEEESLMRELGDALGDAVRATLRASNAASDARSERAILLLSENQEIVHASPGSAVWLEELGDARKDAGPLPHTVRSTVNGARRGAERGAQVSAYVRVRGRSGRWLVVHASLLGDGQVVVTVDEGRPIPLATPLREAYDLSPLQSDVLRDVLLGVEDTELAERLGVTVTSLQTELRGTLQKVGVGRREELAKKLFFEHYYERVQARAPLGADGWFAG
jgi:DNA-binding CsgD family transcriptional regulator